MATSSSTSAGLSVSSLGTTSPLQITGLASGLDTNSIISELMQVASAPLTALEHQQTGLQSLNTNLQSIQSALQGVSGNAQALSDISLFQPAQSITSTDPTLVSASATNGVGAVVGGYQIAVSTMATAAQATYSFTSQSSPNTITVTPSTNGTAGTAQTYNLPANGTAQDLVNTINADSSGSVWGTVVNGKIVFSDRTTGAPSTFTISDSAGSMALQGSATPGVNAQYSINGIPAPSSPSNTVTNAIPGVTLTFGGVTSSAVNVNVGAPSLSTSQITSAIQTFITSYNAVIDQINGQLSQAPSTSDPTVGKLYGDPELTSLLSNMRQTMYTADPTLPSGMASLMDIGISTGAASGGATPNQNAISGHLTLNATTLQQAIQSNPSGVVAVLKSFSQSFTTQVNDVAQVGGTIDTRVQGDNSQLSDLSHQISTMQSTLADKQNQLTQQFAALEGVLSQNQSTSSWLTSQLAALPVA